MRIEAQRAQALSSAAAVLSAFLVFVIGGGVLLGVWAQQRDVAEAAAEQVVIAAEQDRVAEKARQEKAAAKVEAAPETTPKRATRTRTRPVDVVKKKEPLPRTETVQAAKSAKAALPVKPLTGRGNVRIYGDATRVRLVGSKGTFGAGKVPAGSYMIQATFVGFDSRMAGAVDVSDGARIGLVCASSTKTCEVR